MPKSELWSLIWRRSMGRIVSFLTGISNCWPVRLSVIVSVSRRVPVGAPLAVDFVELIFLTPSGLQIAGSAQGTTNNVHQKSTRGERLYIDNRKLLSKRDHAEPSGEFPGREVGYSCALLSLYLSNLLVLCPHLV